MLLELIYRLSYRLRRGKVILHIDRKYLIKDATTPLLKPSLHTRDCRAIRSRCNEIKKALNIRIKIKYSSDKIKSADAFDQNRGRHLMRECNT